MQVNNFTNYYMTVIVGESDCPVKNITNHVNENDHEKCVINLDHENNHICEVVIHSGLRSRTSMYELVLNDGNTLYFDAGKSSCKKRNTFYSMSNFRL